VVKQPANEIEVTRSGPVLNICPNRPASRNALTWAMYEVMSEALADAETDAAMRVIQFSGAGDGFGAGNDLGAFLAAPPSNLDSPAFRFLRTISTVSKVLVAAVHGAAVGVGTTLPLHCDLAVAARSARLSLPFVNLGLVPEAASTLLLPRAVGHLPAAELLLLGKPIDAETALRWGLVNRVVDDDGLMAIVEELISDIVTLPPAAVRRSKALLKDDQAGVAQRIEQEGTISSTAYADRSSRKRGPRSWISARPTFRGAALGAVSMRYRLASSDPPYRGYRGNGDKNKLRAKTWVKQGEDAA
jgi:enoyl-CoA hydratase/carnithine racemase